MKSYQCKTCNRTLRVPNNIGVAPRCHRCGDLMEVSEETPRKRSLTKKRSADQEKRAAKRYNMDVQPASGAMDHAKSDLLKRGVRRGECKYTSRTSFSLKLSELQKVESESMGELAFMEVEFQCVFPHKRFVILSGDDFEQLIRDNDGDTDD